MAIDLEKQLDQIDEVARRQHAHIKAVASDHLANTAEAILQQSAIGVLNSATLQYLQRIAGPGMSSTVVEALNQNGATQTTTQPEGGKPDSGGTHPGTTPGIPEGQGPAPGGTSPDVRWPGRHLAAGAILGSTIAAGTIAGIAYWLWPDTPPQERPPAVQPENPSQAGSMYQYLEDRDAHLPP